MEGTYLGMVSPHPTSLVWKCCDAENCIDSVKNLLDAVRNGDSDHVQACLDEGADLNVRSEPGDTSLYGAAEAGYVDIAELLLDYGGDPNARARIGSTPLHIAAQLGHEHSTGGPAASGPRG